MFRIVLSGATGVLGRAIIEELRGFDVAFVLVGRNRARLLECERWAAPSEAVSVIADLADAGAASNIFSQIDKPIDVLINVAAEQGPVGPFSAVDSQEWERTFRVNFLAPAALCREAITRFGPSGGRIINVSGGGAAGPRPYLSAYASAKTAIVRFSETLALEVIAMGIDVNAIAPGAIASPMTEAILSAGMERSGEAEFAAAMKIAASGTENAKKAAALIAYLLSPDAKGITGKFISAVWDDWSNLHRRWPIPKDEFTLRRVVPEVSDRV